MERTRQKLIIISSFFLFFSLFIALNTSRAENQDPFLSNTESTQTFEEEVRMRKLKALGALIPNVTGTGAVAEEVDMQGHINKAARLTTSMGNVVYLSEGRHLKRKKRWNDFNTNEEDSHEEETYLRKETQLAPLPSSVKHRSTLDYLHREASNISIGGRK